MRASGTLLFALLASLLTPAVVIATPFVNLDFEQATVPPGTAPTFSFSAAAAFPGWTPVYYNTAGIGAAGVVLYNQPLAIGGFPVVEGEFSLALVPGFPTGPEASLSQLGDVPADAKSLRFTGPPSPPAAISINGFELPLTQLTNPNSSLPLWAVDVTSFAGSNVELRLHSVFDVTGICGADALMFSSEPIPEPSFALSLCLIIGYGALRHSRIRA